MLRGDVAANLLTVSVSEGLVRQLDPSFDIIRAALPYFLRFRGWNAATLKDLPVNQPA